MTRGIFAIFVDSGPFLNPGEVAFLSSHEFNGDMGPTMSKGKEYAPKFLNGVNSVEELDDLLYDVTQDFKYELPDEEAGETFHYTDLIPLKELTNKDKRWKVYEEHWESEWNEEKQDYEEFQHYDDNPWVKYFNYTNYAYVKNLTKETLFMETEDGKPIDLAPGQGVILHYGKLYVEGEEENDD